MRSFTKRFISILLTLAMISTSAVACKKSESTSKKKSKKTKTETTANDRDVAEGFKFEKATKETFTEEDPVVEGDGYTFDATLSLLEDEHTLVVKKAKSFPQVDDLQTGGVVYDFTIDDVDEFEGVIEISIPIEKEDNEIIAAGYYDEEAEEWVPVCAQYDGEKMVIYATHLSTYGAFNLSKAKTRNATGTYSVLLDTYIEPVTSEEAEDLLLKPLKNGTADEANIRYEFADAWGKLSSFGNDMGYNALKTVGFTMDFLEEYGDLLSEVGLFFASYQAISQCLNGKPREGVATAFKASFNYVIGLAAGALKSSVMCASMAGVALFDYVLTSYYEKMTSDRKDMYRGGYIEFYAKANRNNGGAYRSAADWFKIFYPMFSSGDHTPEEIKDLVDEEVNKYVNLFWTDEGTMELYFKTAKNGGWTLGGGLNDAIKKELCDEHRANLYNDVFPLVFSVIRDKLQDKVWFEYSQRMYMLGQKLNKTISINFKDSYTDSGKSKYSGYIVKFKELPNDIEDKENWQCTLKKDGTGSISFTGFAYLSNHIQPKLVIVDPDDPDKVVKEFDLAISSNSVTVEIGEDKAPEPTSATPSVITYDPVSEWGYNHNGEPEPKPGYRDEYYIQYVMDNLPNGEVTKNGELYHIDLHASGYPYNESSLDELNVSGDFADRDHESAITANYKITMQWENSGQQMLYTKIVTFTGTAKSAFYDPDKGAFYMTFRGDYHAVTTGRGINSDPSCDVVYEDINTENAMPFCLYMTI